MLLNKRKETRVQIDPGLSANRPSNNWAPEIRFINIQRDTLTFTDLIPLEQILKNFRSCFRVLEYGFITEQHQKRL